MNCYVHQLPGRLRVRIPAAKGNAAAAEKLANQIQALKGITSVQANPVTGSLLIRYDTTITNAATCLAMLRIPSSTMTRNNPEGSRMAEAAMWYLVEKIIERLILAALF